MYTDGKDPLLVLLGGYNGYQDGMQCTDRTLLWQEIT
jgi:hypothetical protein